MSHTLIKASGFVGLLLAATACQATAEQTTGAAPQWYLPPKVDNGYRTKPKPATLQELHDLCEQIVRLPSEDRNILFLMVQRHRAMETRGALARKEAEEILRKKEADAGNNRVRYPEFDNRYRHPGYQLMSPPLAYATSTVTE